MSQPTQREGYSSITVRPEGFGFVPNLKLSMGIPSETGLHSNWLSNDVRGFPGALVGSAVRTTTWPRPPLDGLDVPYHVRMVEK